MPKFSLSEQVWHTTWADGQQIYWRTFTNTADIQNTDNIAEAWTVVWHCETAVVNGYARQWPTSVPSRLLGRWDHGTYYDPGTTYITLWYVKETII